MNENKKVLIVIGVIVAFIALILFAGYQGNREKQKIVDSFYEAFDSKSSKIVYLGRPGCGACASFRPVLEEVVEEYDLSYLDINTDNITTSQLRTIVEELGLDWDDFGTPTLAVVKSGKVIKSQVGAMDEDGLVSFFKDSNIISE